MLKIRIQGTEKDIQWFQKVLERHIGLAVTEVSDLYKNKGTSKFFRNYVEINRVK